MGLLARLRFVLGAARVESFTAPITPVDQLIVARGRAGWSPTISRETALQVPAILRGRNLICAIATLPLVQYGPDRVPARNTLLDQIDPQVPNVVTMAQTVEDLLFDGLAWWRVLGRGWSDFPSSAQHVSVERVHLNPPPGAQSLNLLPSGADPSAAVWIDTEVVDGRDMLRFDSPNPPLLVAARRAIRRAVMLEMAAERYAKSPKALGYFTPAAGAVDQGDDDAIAELLADWRDCRNEDAEGYVPEWLEYHQLVNPSPADLQLVQLQARAALDIANAIGLDPEDLGVSTTSRTYQNATDRRQDRINDVLAPYMRAVTDRLGMNDVTRRGYTTGFSLKDYLKADPVTRATVATALSGLGALTVDEIREDDGRPVLTAAQKRELAPKPAPAPAAAPTEQSTEQGVPVQNTTHTGVVRFSTEPGKASGEWFAFDDATSFAVDAGRRTITGEVIPFGKVGRNWSGRWTFEPGSITWNKSAVSRVKLNDNHYGSPFGAATKLSDTDTAVVGTFKVGRGGVGDEMLMSAEDGIRDGLSAEVTIEEYTIDKTGDAPVNRVTRATLTGVALTATPAFDDARVTRVAASAHERNTPMRCSTCGLDHAPGTPCATPPAPAPAVLSQFTAEQLAAIGQAAAAALAPAPVPAAPTPAPAPVQFSAEDLQAAVATAVQAALSAGEGPAVVNPRRTASTTVTRAELPYRFNGQRGEHDFSTDLFAMVRRKDGEAQARVQEFMEQVFADVSTGDVNELNPTRNRPDLWVDNLDFTTPVWDVINKGSITDSTPFTLPQFNSASGLVAAHSEGTEPTGGTYTTTGQTVTPAPVSGKVEITRETLDQGGNPQVSTLIWGEIIRAYNEALEVAAVAMLDALTPTAIALNGVDSDLDQDVVTNFSALQYIRGGARFRELFVASDLFAALAGAVDDNGRRLYPIIVPTNTGGSTAADYSFIQVGSLQARPAWATEVANGGDGSSYLFNRSDCHGWASPPRKLDFEYEVKSVWLGVWGYQVCANTRLAGVREITYTA